MRARARIVPRDLEAGMEGKKLSEKEIEKKLRDRVRQRGGCAYKFVSPGMSGVPDRLVVMPDNRIGFVELKAPGKVSRPEQCHQQRRLERLGCYVAVLDDPDMIDTIIDEIETWDDAGLDLLERLGQI